MKMIAASMWVALMGFSREGCEGPSKSAETNDRETVQEQQKVYATTQPIPMFKWSQDRDNLIQIYKMKNESRMTYAVVRSQGTGAILWDCPSTGFPIPVDTQLTNPLQAEWRQWGQTGGGVAMIAQAEPNGLFTSPNTDATYVICLDKDGIPSPQYTEEKVESFTRPIKVEDGKVIFLDGPSTMAMKKNE